MHVRIHGGIADPSVFAQLFYPEEHAWVREHASSSLAKFDRGFPELPPRVTPARELVADRVIEVVELGAVALTGWAKQDVEDALGVGLNEAGESVEHLADDRAGLLGRILEEHVVGVGDRLGGWAASPSAVSTLPARWVSTTNAMTVRRPPHGQAENVLGQDAA